MKARNNPTTSSSQRTSIAGLSDVTATASRVSSAEYGDLVA
jgi:hypothetical protein